MTSNQQSHSHSGYLGRNGDDPVQRNNAFFQNNNVFPGFDSQLSNGHAHPLTTSEGWEYDAGRLNLAHNHDPSTSLYPGWHTTSHQHSLSTTDAPESHNEYYPKQYPNGVAQFQNAAFGSSVGFDHPTQSNFKSSNVDSPTASTSNYQIGDSNFPNATAQLGTIAPGALQQRPSMYGNNSSNSQTFQSNASTRAPPVQSVAKPLPKGVPSGRFFIITPETLAQSITSRRLHSFVHLGDEAQDVWSTKTTIPAYVPRKSRNEIKKLLANDSGLTAKIAQKPMRRAHGTTLKIPDRKDFVGVIKRDASRREDSASTTPEYSDDDSTSDSSEEESMQAPLPAVRPSKSIDAVKYDTIKTLWRVPYRSATSDDIRKGLADFWDIVRTIRDRWKSDTQAVKDAEEAKKENELPLLRERVSNQREMLEAALQAAIAEGHKDIVEHLAENLQLILALVQFLQDRVRNMDFNSDLSRVILEVFSRCKTLTDGNLEKTGLAKVLTRLLKRGDESIRFLTKRIGDNATTATKKRKDTTKVGSVSVSQVKEVKTAPPPLQKAESPMAGLKRSRISENSSDPPSKRVAADSSVTLTGQSKAALPPKRSSSGSESKTQPTTPAITVAKKATQVIAKPSSFFSNNFSGLQSAKRPATSAAAKPTVQAKPATASAKPASTAASPTAAIAPPRPLFSIADTLASVSRPREVASVTKREESVSPETSEERTRRLRKEGRRRLRVSFKPEGSLVEIREITPQAEEENGPNTYEVRDAGDIDSEGRMFKLQHNEDMMDLDDEDDAETAPMDDLSRAFDGPSAIDFSDMPAEERERMYAPYGGGVQVPECPEREIQERREAITLITIYAQPSDVPPTPKEPTETLEESTSLKQFGPAPDHVLARLESLEKAQKLVPSATPSISTIDLAALLSAMPQQLQQQQPQQPQQPQQTQQQQPAQAPPTELEKIFAQFSQPAQPTPAMQSQPQFPQQQTSTLATMQGYYGMPNPAVTQFPQQTPQTYQPPAQSAAGIPDNISAMLASLQQAGQMVNMPVGAGLPDFSQYAVQQQQQQQQLYAAQQQQVGYAMNYTAPQGASTFENPERRRLIEGGAMDLDGGDGMGMGMGMGDGFGGGKKGWGGGGGGGGAGKRKEGRPTPKFVVQCKYWKEGKCRKGAECTFLHTG